MSPRTTTAAAITAMVLVGAALTGCGTDSDAATTTPSASAAAVTVDATQNAAAVLAANQATHVKDGDATWSAAEAVTIALNGGSAKVSGQGATATGGTVKITAGGTYRTRPCGWSSTAPPSPVTPVPR